MTSGRKLVYLTCAAFVAATLQGSRLPDEATDARTTLARVDAATEHRAGSGADKDEYLLPAGASA